MEISAAHLVHAYKNITLFDSAVISSNSQDPVECFDLEAKALSGISHYFQKNVNNLFIIYLFIHN